MFLITAIDLIIVVTLLTVISSRGLERALPYYVFFVTLMPGECRIPLPGLFDLSTRRLALIIMTVAFISRPKKCQQFRNLPLKNLILAHAAWVLLSTATSIVFMTSVKQLLAQVIEYYITYYILFRTISHIKTIKSMGMAMISAMAVACVFGVIEVYAGWSILSIFPAELQEEYGFGGAVYAEVLDRGIRARSVFTHPILFGGAISMLIPLGLHFLTTIRSTSQRLFLNTAMLLMFWNLYKTSSRGPWLATILALGILLIAASARVKKRVVFLGIIAAVVLIIRPGVAETIWNMYLATADPTSRMGASYAYRPVLLRTVNETLLGDPFRAIIGFGTGAFRDKGLILVLPGIETHRWFTCDSAWILFMYESGYVGVSIIAVLLLTPIAMVLRCVRRLAKEHRHFLITCVSSMVSFYFVMVSVSSYIWGQNGHMLWMLIAMTISYIYISRTQSAAGVPARLVAERWPSGILPPPSEPALLLVRASAGFR